MDSLGISEPVCEKVSFNTSPEVKPSALINPIFTQPFSGFELGMTMEPRADPEDETDSKVTTC